MVMTAVACIVLPATGVRADGSLSLPDGTMSVGPYLDASPWWDDTSYKRVISAETIDAQNQPVTVSGQISNIQFTGTTPASEPFWIEIGLMTDAEYQAREVYNASTNPDAYLTSTGRAWNRGIYFILMQSAATPTYKMHLQDYGGQSPDPDVMFSEDGTYDFSFTLTPSGSYGGTASLTVNGNIVCTDMPYGAYNPVVDSDYSLVENFCEAHLFVSMLSYFGETGETVTLSYSGVEAIPAPGAALLGAMGLAMVGWLKRRRKDRKNEGARE
jgi:hypothetical protein